MGLWSQLFGKGKSKHEIALETFRGKFGKEALLPSFPAIDSNLEPLKRFTVGEFHIDLCTNVPPYPRDDAGDSVIPVCLSGFNSDASIICMYTAQRMFPNEPPRVVVWQKNGQYRIHSNMTNEFLDPNLFLQSQFANLAKELGLSGNIEVVELKRR